MYTQALCNKADPTPWDRESPKAKSICLRCPVQPTCLRQVLRYEADDPSDKTAGTTIGGLTRAERAQVVEEARLFGPYDLQQAHILAQYIHRVSPRTPLTEAAADLGANHTTTRLAKRLLGHTPTPAQTLLGRQLADQHEEQLRCLVHEGITVTDIAEHLQQPESAVRAALHHMNLSTGPTQLPPHTWEEKCQTAEEIDRLRTQGHTLRSIDHMWDCQPGWTKRFLRNHRRQLERQAMTNNRPDEHDPDETARRIGQLHMQGHSYRAIDRMWRRSAGWTSQFLTRYRQRHTPPPGQGDSYSPPSRGTRSGNEPGRGKTCTRLPVPTASPTRPCRGSFRRRFMRRDRQRLRDIPPKRVPAGASQHEPSRTRRNRPLLASTENALTT